eukprot:GSChrysophyteH2.ASY1.ANO1.1306.1 assembled CDS
MRGGRQLKLKGIVDAALDDSSVSVTSVFVYCRGSTLPGDAADTAELQCNMVEGRDLDMVPLLRRAQPHCPCEWIDAEDTMFILYTSGSTGKPKGVAHTTGGYLVHAALSTKSSFDIREGDVYACVADC